MKKQNARSGETKGSKRKNEVKWWQTVLAIFAIFCVINFLWKGDSGKKDNSTDSTKETLETSADANGWTDADYAEFITIVEKMSDEYVANYKAPWGKDGWTFANFDDTGKIVATTKYTFENADEKQDVFCVFARDGEKMFGHYLSIGGKVYIDDGTCDDFFENIASLSE